MIDFEGLGTVARGPVPRPSSARRGRVGSGSMQGSLGTPVGVTREDQLDDGNPVLNFLRTVGTTVTSPLQSLIGPSRGVGDVMGDAIADIASKNRPFDWSVVDSPGLGLQPGDKVPSRLLPPGVGKPVIGGTPLGGGGAGGGGGGGGAPAAPAQTGEDLLRALQDRILESQLAGVQSGRDLVSELAAMRETGFTEDEQFAQDLRTSREANLAELTETERAAAEGRAAAREERFAADQQRRQTQLNDALAASGKDVDRATSTLANIGIDAGSAFAGETDENSSMLYSQFISGADFSSSLNDLSISAAEFARDANDMASVQAMQGIEEDLTFSLKAIDDARQAGLISDKQALQALDEAERAARRESDIAKTQLDVVTLEKAEAAAAARARAAAAAANAARQGADRVYGLQALARQVGLDPSLEELAAIEAGGGSEDYIDLLNEFFGQGLDVEAALAQPVDPLRQGNYALDAYNTLYDRLTEEQRANLLNQALGPSQPYLGQMYGQPVYGTPAATKGVWSGLGEFVKNNPQPRASKTQFRASK